MFHQKYSNPIHISSYGNQIIKPRLKQSFDICLFQVLFFILFMSVFTQFFIHKVFICYVGKNHYETFSLEYNK